MLRLMIWYGVEPLVAADRRARGRLGGSLSDPDRPPIRRPPGRVGRARGRAGRGRLVAQNRRRRGLRRPADRCPRRTCGAASTSLSRKAGRPPSLRLVARRDPNVVEQSLLLGLDRRGTEGRRRACGRSPWIRTRQADFRQPCTGGPGGTARARPCPRPPALARRSRPSRPGLASAGGLRRSGHARAHLCVTTASIPPPSAKMRSPRWPPGPLGRWPCSRPSSAARFPAAT